MTSSVLEWIIGTAIIPIFLYLLMSFLLAVVYRGENDRLLQLLRQKNQLKRTVIEDFGMTDQLFLICCWPEALIAILSSDTPEKDKIKLQFYKSKVLVKLLEKVEMYLF